MYKNVFAAAAASFMISLTAGYAEEIFDGRSLDGWEVKGDACWSAADGILTGQNTPAKKGSILWTRKSYKDFKLDLEFRYNGRIDSGVFLRNDNEQIQIGFSGLMRRDLTCSPYIASKRGYPAEAEGVAGLLKEGEWNRMTIVARGDVYTVSLAGKEVLTYKSDGATESGPIGVQVHQGMDMKIEFRNLTVKELPGEPAAEKKDS